MFHDGFSDFTSDYGKHKCGNAYAFLAIYQKTEDEEYFKKAKLFCNFICDYGKHQCRTPERPFSKSISFLDQ